MCGCSAEVRDSAPGADGVRLSYIKLACAHVTKKFTNILIRMTTKRAGECEETLKKRQIVTRFKKGDSNNAKNYRGISLPSMGSRIMARLLTNRLEGCLLDLQKSYPRFNKPALWEMLRRLGMGGNFLATLMDLHESSLYCVKTKEGETQVWHRFCSTSSTRRSRPLRRR